MALGETLRGGVARAARERPERYESNQCIRSGAKDPQYVGVEMRHGQSSRCGRHRTRRSVCLERARRCENPSPGRFAVELLADRGERWGAAMACYCLHFHSTIRIYPERVRYFSVKVLGRRARNRNGPTVCRLPSRSEWGTSDIVSRDQLAVVCRKGG